MVFALFALLFFGLFIYSFIDAQKALFWFFPLKPEQKTKGKALQYNFIAFVTLVLVGTSIHAQEEAKQKGVSSQEQQIRQAQDKQDQRQEDEQSENNNNEIKRYDENGNVVSSSPKPQYGGKVLQAKDFGDKWCLNVDKCEIVCEKVEHPRLNLVKVFCYANGKKYAVNGTAMVGDYNKIDGIWKDDPNIKGIKVSISILLDVCLK